MFSFETCCLQLYRNRITDASNAKRWIEQRQRDEEDEREESGTKYRQQHFRKPGDDNDDWKYKDELSKRTQI